MKHTILLSILLSILITLNLSAQPLIKNTFKYKAPAEYDNIHVEPLHTDSLSTSVLIWIKKEVKPHRHEVHTEQVFVLEGTGVMKVGKLETRVKSGDMILIPMNTVHSVKVTSTEPLKVLSIQSPEFKGKDRIFVE